ncbi:MAG TPA: HisA/HisF-related TIM barrel protein, partial [Candidatus Dormibacteraeota bacterium]|nr:HisA/HisF-related TIM barrel protein [Candidatus Dormibacteraeota bacterium]
LRIHVVDLDAARGQGDNFDVVRAVVEAAGVAVEVGGGVRSPDVVERLLSAGASHVIVGTVAAERPGDVGAWTRRWPGRIYVGLDARAGVIATHGWEKSGAWTVEEMLNQYRDAPVAGFIYTDISRDGAMEGAATDSLEAVVAHSQHGVILAGGVTTLDDITAARRAGAAGAIVGKALYEGRLTLSESLAAAG